MSIKKKIKIDGNLKLKKSITINNNNNSTEEPPGSPVLKDLDKNISNFNFKDINIINNNINILNNDSFQKSIISMKDNSDINLITNENININEIINEKREKEEKEKEEKKKELKKENEEPNKEAQIVKENTPEQHKIKNTIKELEEFNEKKPKLVDERNNIMARKRMRSYSKNRDRKNFDSLSMDKDFEGSLKDVKLMIEGVSGILNKINIKSTKKSYSKRKIIYDDKLPKLIKSEKKLNIEKQDNKSNLLEEIDKEIMELIEAEEKRQKLKKEADNKNKNDNLENCNNNNENNATEIKNNEKEYRSSRFKEKNNDKDNNKSNKKNKKEKTVRFKEDIIKKDISIIPEESKSNINEDNYNLSLVKKYLKYEKDEIMSESIINRINTEDNILTKSLNESNRQIKDNENKENEKIEIILVENDKIENGKKDNNYLKNIEKQLIEKNKLNIDDQYDVIQNESRIMRDENLLDLINQSLNQSSLNNQSSIMNQSLLDHFIFISKEPNILFSIENTLKFEKIKCLEILDFLNFQEKMEFTGIHRGFKIERISLLNTKREDYIRSLELSNRETIDDAIMKIRLKYSKDELSKPFGSFQVSRGPSKAVELLNIELYSKIFKKNKIDKKDEEKLIIFRALFILFGEFDIANIYNIDKFWEKCIEYINRNSNGKIGTFILEKIKNITFEHKKIFLLNKLLIGMKNKIVPNYFSKICGTTGLLVFIVKDALEYCGVIQNDKKTQPSRILDNLLYYKNTIDTLALFIDYLSGIKTYRITDKKDIK